jgi:hypothetical protein
MDFISKSDFTTVGGQNNKVEEVKQEDPAEEFDFASLDQPTTQKK